MGWSGGTKIFDAVTKEVLELKLESKQTKAILKSLIVSLEEHDWGNIDESDYYDHKLVKSVIKEIHPEWEL